MHVSWRQTGTVARPEWNPRPDAHPSQVHARRILLDPDDADAWADLAQVYADQADGWATWTAQQVGYADALGAALEDVPRGGVWVEFAAGSGESAPAIPAGARLLRTELLEEVVRDAPPGLGPWVVADARALPVPTACVDVLVGLNAVPAVAEARRVVRPGGSLVLAYSFGPHTPVYLSPDDVLEQLGPGWEGVAEHGPWGTWARFVRA